MLQTKWMHAIKVLLNYAGGAYIYIRREYASRIRIIQRSWKTANKQAEDEFEEAIASVGATGPCMFPKELAAWSDLKARSKFESSMR